jgi:hypothetical protein
VLLGECQVRDLTVTMVMLPGTSLYLQSFIIEYGTDVLVAFANLTILRILLVKVGVV